MGELAQLTNVTKRTIDYYTNMGLLKAERSSSNYRYYDRNTIGRIELIEQRKKQGMSLDEIKKEIISKYSEEVDILELRLKIKHLDEDVTKVISQLQESDEVKPEDIKKSLSKESISLMQSLLLLLNIT
ncbi:hypothetical protein DRW41_10965 [Neobacillus piezotolerans]|uniref:HTH merR-type domain-containing protein n=1 Tax=Neobacillus piezotolerans TaxID=2259171 RepID=A0A3D8GRT4_9BACI|nr:MerR family transcriptional regulator [Neobacillus piezotolerans]RDU37193.1 hypothetical protein DRW41_10965 [Neobacillus piezotolerans]